jgi:putative oxidoreductase
MMAIVARTLSLYQLLAGRMDLWLAPVSDLFLRLVAARVFLNSGLSKWNGWFDFDEQKHDLFLYEYFCPEPVRPGALLLCDPETLDYVDGSAIVTFVESLALTAGVLEVLLPALLIVGLFSRFAALGLIGMTLFIQLAVFPGWGHWWNPAVWWFVALFAVMARGPGAWSLDRILGIEKAPAQRA